MVADLFEHTPDLAVLAFHKSELIPRVVSLANNANFRRCGLDPSRLSKISMSFVGAGVFARACMCIGASNVFRTTESTVSCDHQPAPKFFYSRCVRLSRNLDDINLRHMRCGLHQLMGE